MSLSYRPREFQKSLTNKLSKTYKILRAGQLQSTIGDVAISKHREICGGDCKDLYKIEVHLSNVNLLNPLYTQRAIAARRYTYKDVLSHYALITRCS